MSSGDKESCIGGEAREFNGRSQLLLPNLARGIVQEPESEVRIAEKQLLGGAPGQGTNSLIVVFAAKGLN